MILSSHASDTFNQELTQQLRDIGKAVEAALKSNLVALVLGGGYGRGEGGVITVDHRERPYNDLDFFLIVKNKRKVPYKELERISHTYEPILNIHVDFSRPLTVKDIRALPHWLMWYDLLGGYKVIAGDEDVLEKNAPHSIRQTLPPIEATRLLLNRAAGIIWALRVVRQVEPEPDKDFVRRNYYKCLLALGDALLIVTKNYQSAYRGRDALVEKVLQTLPSSFAPIRNAYAEALTFKFTPDRLAATEPSEAKLLEVAGLFKHVWRYVESERTGFVFNTAEEYSCWTGIREGSTHVPNLIAKNVYMNAKYKRISLKHPREHLYRAVCPLLQPVPSPIEASTWPEESQIFLNVWFDVN